MFWLKTHLETGGAEQNQEVELQAIDGPLYKQFWVTAVQYALWKVVYIRLLIDEHAPNGI